MGLKMKPHGLFHKILDVARAEYPNCRCDYKTNAKGELVIAAIIPPSYPGEWSDVNEAPRRGRRNER